MTFDVRSAALGALLVVVGGAVGAVAMTAMAPSPKTYDECLLAEMQGQPANVGVVAQRVCRERFPAPEVGPATKQLLDNYR